MVFLLFGCGEPKTENTVSLHKIKDLKTRQYAIAGRELYVQHCANCHQKDGTGLGLVIPPLKDSDYMINDLGRTVRIIRHGLKGEIIVNGQVYNQPMPGNPILKPIEIAQITTYIYTVWGQGEILVTPDQVSDYLKP
ncbi:major anaerobically induced transmembrane protein [Lunatimonas lonarensis]|uniref:Major anaerobically induced transmembrane protein n=2 Tax=Lunatimonas lonarensis TaxID=1232681 RepID=R7ZQ40_9BACT|nr:major anaerobically induced transmembrane protein [Lunatimonas lonarensis]